MPLLRGYWKLTGKVLGILVGAVTADVLAFTAKMTFESPFLKYYLFLTGMTLVQLPVGYWFLKSESAAENFWVHFWGALNAPRAQSFFPGQSLSHALDLWFDLFKGRQWAVFT